MVQHFEQGSVDPAAPDPAAELAQLDSAGGESHRHDEAAAAVVDAGGAAGAMHLDSARNCYLAAALAEANRQR